MASGRWSAEVAEKVYDLLQKHRGSQAEACRRAGVNKNYFADCVKKYGSIDMHAFLTALEVVGIHPEIFFRTNFPADLRELAGGFRSAMSEPDD